MEARSKRLWIVTLSNIAVTILFLIVVYGAMFERAVLGGWPTFILLPIALALSVTALRLTKRVASSTSRRVAFAVNGSALALDSLIILGLGTMFAVAPMERVLSFLRSPADRAIQEDDICETVFRYRMDHEHIDGPFFLDIDGKDPSDAFIARFARPNKTVKKASGSYFKKEPFPGWLRDQATDEKAVAFSVRSISWMSLDQVEVRGGMYCGGLCADWGIYRLKKKNGRWAVEDYKVEGVS